MKRIQTDEYASISDSIRSKLEAVGKYPVPRHETGNSTFRYYELADSFSKIHDTVNAEKYFSLVDTYHLLSLQVANGANDLMSRFALRDSVKLNTKKILSALPRSAYFDLFASYYMQVQNYRKFIGDNTDVIFEDSLRKLDSIQQDYLWNYLMKHGSWPTLNNGAMFASLIASRDIEYFYRYVPFAVNAYNNNKISSGQLKLILDNKKYFSSYMEVVANMRYRYTRHDLSWCLVGKVPYMTSSELMNKIAADAKGKCPVKNIFSVHFVKNMKTFKKNDYCNDEGIRNDAYDLLAIIDKNCPKFRNLPNGRKCTVYHLPNLMYDAEKLFFYIIY